VTWALSAQARQLGRTKFRHRSACGTCSVPSELKRNIEYASRPQRGPLRLNKCGVPSSEISRDKAKSLLPIFGGRKKEEMLRAYLNYGLIASVVIWAAIVGVMAYRLNESPWRWAFVALVFCGGLTVAVIIWIKKYVDRLNEAEEKRESKL